MRLCFGKCGSSSDGGRALVKRGSGSSNDVGRALDIQTHRRAAASAGILAAGRWSSLSTAGRTAPGSRCLCSLSGPLASGWGGRGYFPRRGLAAGRPGQRGVGSDQHEWRCGSVSGGTSGTLARAGGEAHWHGTPCRGGAAACGGVQGPNAEGRNKRGGGWSGGRVGR